MQAIGEVFSAAFARAKLREEFNSFASEPLRLWCYRSGEEVTINYGGHPNEVFYLFYGFLPDQNPSDITVLFGSYEEVAPYAERLDIQHALKHASTDHCRCHNHRLR